MSSIDLLTFSLCLAMNIWTGYLVSIVTESQVHVLDAGDSVVLECFFKADGYNMFDYPLLWRKVQRGEETQVNVMGNVNQPFLGTGRYEVTFAPTGPIYKLRLYLSGVTQEDSGNYTCEVRGPQSTILGHVTHFILVRAPIEGVIILTDDESNTRSELSLVENVPSSLQCIVFGGFPAPTIELEVGDRDVTSQFHFRNIANITGNKGLRLIAYRSERWSISFHAWSGDNQATVRCHATVPGMRPVAAFAKLEVLFAPKISCFTSRAFLGERNVNLKCEIRSNPRIFALFWVIDDNGTTLAEGEVIDERWILVADRTDKVVETQLFLHRLVPESFRRYTLVAENRVAVSKDEAELLQNVVTRSIDSSNFGSRSQIREISNMTKPKFVKGSTRTSTAVTSRIEPGSGFACGISLLTTTTFQIIFVTRTLHRN